MLKKKKAWQAWTNSLETLTGLLLHLTMSFPEQKLVQTSHTIYTPINTTVLLRTCLQTKCETASLLFCPMLLCPRAYRAVAGVGVWDVHNLRDGFSLLVLMTFNTSFLVT